MSRADILREVEKIALSAVGSTEEHFPGFSEDAWITKDLGFQSIGMLYMVIAIEEVFSIRVNDAGVSDFVTVKDLVDYIERKLA